MERMLTEKGERKKRKGRGILFWNLSKKSGIDGRGFEGCEAGAVVVMVEDEDEDKDEVDAKGVKILEGLEDVDDMFDVDDGWMDGWIDDWGLRCECATWSIECKKEADGLSIAGTYGNTRYWGLVTVRQVLSLVFSSFDPDEGSRRPAHGTNKARGFGTGLLPVANGMGAAEGPVSGSVKHLRGYCGDWYFGSWG